MRGWVWVGLLIVLGCGSAPVRDGGMPGDTEPTVEQAPETVETLGEDRKASWVKKEPAKTAEEASTSDASKPAAAGKMADGEGDVLGSLGGQAPNGRVAVKGGGTTVSGGLDVRVIRKVLRRRQGPIKACYERALRHDPSLQGKVVVAWEIGAAGRVSGAKVVSSTMDDASVAACVVAAVRRMRFPKPRGGGHVKISYPFVFSSQ